jgi:hypothetical protein
MLAMRTGSIDATRNPPAAGADHAMMQMMMAMVMTRDREHRQYYSRNVVMGGEMGVAAGSCGMMMNRALIHGGSCMKQLMRGGGSASTSCSNSISSGGGGGGGGIMQNNMQARAPRMRWTSSLHAHFVHAVELLGGHESTSSDQQLNLYIANYSRRIISPVI